MALNRGRFQIIERVDLGMTLGLVDPRAHGGRSIVVELQVSRGDRLVQFGAAIATTAPVTYPSPIPLPVPLPMPGMEADLMHDRTMAAQAVAEAIARAKADAGAEAAEAAAAVFAAEVQVGLGLS